MSTTEFDSVAFHSLSSIRSRHVELMRQTLEPGAASKFSADIVDFMHRVAAAGAHLGADDERSAAQNILDYWNTTLLTSHARKLVSAPPIVLADFAHQAFPNLTPPENPFASILPLGLNDRLLLLERGTSVAAVIERLQKHHVACITGSSASGRTSLAMAGVAAQLKERWIDASTVLVIPSFGASPVRALSDILPDGSNVSAKELRKNPKLLTEKLNQACGDRPALIVVDNVEDLFTRCSDPTRRAVFAQAIAAVLTERRHFVLLVVLDRFFAALQEMPGLAPYVTAETQYILPPPSAAEIQRALTALANGSDLRVDSECVADVARDLQSDPRAFALAKFMLLHLWPLARQGFAGPEAFRSIGRTYYALARVAGQTFGGLSEKGQEAAERIFLTLCRPDVHNGLVSQRESVKSLDSGGSDAAADEALRAFRAAGILRTSERSEDSVAIISDRLMSQWTRLAGWLEGKKDRRFQVFAAAELWQKSRRSPAYLFNDENSIRDAEQYYLDSTPESEVLRQFLNASRDALGREQERRYWRLATFLGLSMAVVFCLITIIYLIWYIHSNEERFVRGDTDKLQVLDRLDQSLINLSQDATLKDFRVTDKLKYFEETVKAEEKDLLLNIKFWQWFGSSDVDLSLFNFMILIQLRKSTVIIVCHTI